jgi:predicted dehydrogenase
VVHKKTEDQMANDIRIGLIGAGIMGQGHLRYMHELKDAKFTCVADVSEAVIQKTVQEHKIEGFHSAEALMDSGLCDAVLIATPHRDHPPLAMRAFDRGLHVLTEKPVAVTAQDAQAVNQAYQKVKDKLVYAAMFNMRFYPRWQMVKKLMEEQRIGKLMRVNWVITTWFRTAAYYRSSDWRATWKGEGGGVLINQCPHNLDMLQWLVGMPTRVTAVGGLGKYHDIEVEDEMTAILEFPSGATGVFVASTAETPGTNRLEIVGDHGQLIVSDQDELIHMTQTRDSVRHISDTTKDLFAVPEADRITIAPAGAITGHRAVTQHFVDVIRDGGPLISPGVDGINSLELGNAMLMSAIRRTPIDIPTPRAEYAAMLEELASAAGRTR